MRRFVQGRADCWTFGKLLWNKSSIIQNLYFRRITLTQRSAIVHVTSRTGVRLPLAVLLHSSHPHEHVYMEIKLSCSKCMLPGYDVGSYIMLLLEILFELHLTKNRKK